MDFTDVWQDMSARRQKRLSRPRPWASISVVGSPTVHKPSPGGQQVTAVGTSRKVERLAPQSRLPVFNGDTKANTSVAHPLVVSFASASCRLPRLAAKWGLFVEKSAQRGCATSETSCAAGAMASSPPTQPVQDEIEVRRAESSSSADSDG